MSFGENLQFLRKKNNITQEQLAEQLNVSRQSVSKWESENSYPEMEKLLQLCDLFTCNMDTLLRGNIEETVIEDTVEYDRHMNAFSISIAAGVALIISGIGLNALLESMGVLERICDATFLCFVAVAICIFVVSGAKHSIFCNNHPSISQFYSPNQLKKFDRIFPTLVGVGVTLIILGVIFLTATEGIPAPFGYTEEFYTSIFMFNLAVAISILAYTGIQKSKYDVKTYNKENEREKSGKMTKTGKWCGVIMLIATILFLCSIGISLMEHPGNWSGWRGSIISYSWIVFPIGGLVCAIVSIIFAQEEKDDIGQEK